MLDVTHGIIGLTFDKPKCVSEFFPLRSITTINKSLILKLDISLPEYFSQVLDTIDLLQGKLFLQISFQMLKILIKQLWLHLAYSAIADDQEGRSVFAAYFFGGYRAEV